MLHHFTRSAILLEKAIKQEEFTSVENPSISYYAFHQPYGNSYEIREHHGANVRTFRFDWLGQLLGYFSSFENGDDELHYDRFSGYGDEHQAILDAERLLNDIQKSLCATIGSPQGGVHGR